MCLTVPVIPESRPVFTAINVGYLRVDRFAIFVVVSLHTVYISIFIHRINTGESSVITAPFNYGGVLLLAILLLIISCATAADPRNKQ